MFIQVEMKNVLGGIVFGHRRQRGDVFHLPPAIRGATKSNVPYEPETETATFLKRI